MKTCRKIAVAFFSFGIMVGCACAQENEESRQPQPAGEKSKNTGYGRRMHRNIRYEGYCDGSPCSGYRRANRMSHRDREMLRQQVDEAGKNLYTEHHHN